MLRENEYLVHFSVLMQSNQLDFKDYFQKVSAIDNLFCPT